ncbi:ParA family protein, partial [bacterium]|nr:ParA family protein [bacterium]
ADPQANSTRHLGLSPKSLERTMFDLLRGTKTAEEILIKDCSGGIDLLPSRKDLSAIEMELVNEVDRETFFRRRLGNGFLAPYDYVIIDTPPSLGMVTINILSFVDEVFIPVKSDYFSLEGIDQLFQVMNLIKKSHNKRLEVTGIILTMFDARTRLSKDIQKEVQDYFQKKVFSSIIRQNTKIAEAPGFGKTIYQYDKKGNGAADFLSLSKEIIKQG